MYVHFLTEVLNNHAGIEIIHSLRAIIVFFGPVVSTVSGFFFAGIYWHFPHYPFSIFYIYI